MNTTAPRIGSVLRLALAVCAGIGLGLSWSLAGDRAADVASAPSTGQNAGTSSAVSAATWTDGPWPFTVGEGELRCVGPEDDPGVFLVTAAGETFALNPAAILMAGRVGALVELGPIWRDHPDIPGAKVNVSPMILHALKLC